MLKSVSGIIRNISSKSMIRSSNSVSLPKGQTDSFTRLSENGNNYKGPKDLNTIETIGMLLYRILKPVEQKSFPEKIEFKAAKTMEEATEYAMNTFGIKLEAGDNLFTANIINETCADISNAMKGKVIFPEKIGLVDEKYAQSAKRKYRGVYKICENAVYLNKQDLAGKKRNKAIGQTRIFAEELNNYSKQGLDYTIIKNIFETSPLSEQKKAIYSMKYCIAHELGHCNHFLQNKRRFLMNLFQESSFQRKINLQSIKECCSNFFISDNYKANINEFVADTFAQKIMGKEIPQKIRILYSKFCGVPSMI